MRRLFHFEKKAHPIASPEVFSRRLAFNGLLALGTIGMALAIGMAGYMEFEAMGFIDAFANAAMILSGMGPLSPLQTNTGKIFAGVYAIFSGLLFIGVAGLLLAPVFHRLLHRFHVDEADQP